MAKSAHSTPTSTSHVTAATPHTSRRLTLFAAAGAIIMGSGITAGAAASVADLLEPSPDAELVAACQRVRTAVEKQDALLKPFEMLEPRSAYYRAHSDAAYEAVWDLATTEYHPGIVRAAELPAQTKAGLQAKARLLLETLNPDDDDDALALSLARDVLAGRV